MNSFRATGRQQASSNFSLAAAAFDFPAADDCAAPTQHAPAAWRALFENCHLAVDKGVREVLGRSCKAGLQWVEDTAPLRLDLSADPQEWQQQLTAVETALTERGGLPSRLWVTVSVFNDSAADSALRTLLQTYGGSIVEVHIYWVHRGVETAPAHAHGPYAARLLPAPARLPRLESVRIALLAAVVSRIYNKQQSLLANLALYTTQMSSLDVSWGQSNITRSSLFYCSIPTTTLTHFTTDVDLDDQLLGLLLENAPNLRVLSVGKLGGSNRPVLYLTGLAVAEYRDSQRTLGRYADRQWGLREVRVRGMNEVGLLARLPRSVGGSLRLTGASGAWRYLVNSVQGFDADVAAGLSSWQFETQSLVIAPHYRFRTADRPTALCHVLTQLQHLRESSAIIELCGWFWLSSTPPKGFTVPQVQQMNDQMLHLMQVGLRWLPGLRFGVGFNGTPTQQALALAYQLSSPPEPAAAPPHTATLGHTSTDLTSQPQGSKLHSVSFTGMSMDENHFASWPSGWKELRCRSGTVQASELLGLVHVGGEGECRIVRCRELVFDTMCAWAEVDVDALKQWLHRVQWAPLAGNTLYIHLDLRIVLDPAGLFSLLHSVRLHRPVEPSDRADVTLRVTGLALTRASMELLRGLPHWCGTLDLSRCTWPEPVSAYTELATIVPTSYTTVEVGVPPGDIQQAANAHRKRLRVAPLIVFDLLTWLS